jgi:aromatic ring-opening dioxygenase catalytic subunit (LigB family)
MAELVAVYAVPHTPSFVAEVQLNGDRSETSRYFGKIKRHLDQAKPDVILTVNNDHFNTFFFDNWPTFAIGISEATSGPNDQTPGMPRYNLKVEASAARYILSHLIREGFDFTSSVDFEIDHGALVPLHFLTPSMSLPIVPVFINCVVPPLPTSTRCYELGRSIAAAVRTWERDVRVAVVASGSLSLEIGGPRVDLDKTFGIPDPSWASWILDRITLSEHDALLAQATEPRMLGAGNVAGELLNWIIALGVVGASPPQILINQPDLGNAFAAWNAKGERP